MRWYIVAASAMALTACRADEKSDRALGAERDGLQHGGQPATQPAENRIDWGQVQNYEEQARVESAYSVNEARASYDEAQQQRFEEQQRYEAQMAADEQQRYEEQMAADEQAFLEEQAALREERAALREDRAALREDQAALREDQAALEEQAAQEASGGAIVATDEEVDRRVTGQTARERGENMAAAAASRSRVAPPTEYPASGGWAPMTGIDPRGALNQGSGNQGLGNRGVGVTPSSQEMRQQQRNVPTGSPYTPGQRGGTSAQPNQNPTTGSPYTSNQQAPGVRPGQSQGTGMTGIPGRPAMPSAPAVQAGPGGIQAPAPITPPTR
ncbi:hypothetical protein [Chondromyces apiculatus]|uniref:Uncharacterized protein n=1 Tax=Chondromyces apiculatus DSM 436 TaxID=1192034 RepID=A0A017T132_9BACT|nr:hypothetical protein [Chondromyces apiculatus]EYF02933.1 Hypothetical protein CAP_6356 [Chondromyces apiculatus DSM 436]